MKIIITLFCLLLTSHLSANTLTFEGAAYKPGTDKLLYLETHTLELNNDRPISGTVEYRLPSGEVIARKTNQYLDNPALTNFELQDVRNEYQEQAELTDKGWRLSQTENGKTSSKRVGKPDYQPVVDAGFDEFVRANWDRLIDGDTVKFSFAVPARQEWIDFRLIPDTITDTELSVEMKLKSRMLAWLLDPIRLTYDRSSKRLTRYQGLTNIQDPQGEGIHADIIYTYD